MRERDERRRYRRRNIAALLMTVVTGLGHARLGYALTGAMLFAVFLMSLNAAILGRLLLSEPELAAWMRGLGTPLAAGVWVWGFVDVIRLGFRRDRVRLRQRRRELLQRSLLAYLGDQLEDAHRILTRAIRYDVDWEEPGLLFHLGVLELRRAERLEAEGDERGASRHRRLARRAFRRYLSRDPDQRWRSEIALECQSSGLAPPRGLR